MPLILWSSKLLMNIREIDKQHEKLVNIINSLDDAMQSQRDDSDTNNITAKLVEYTRTHFTTEENYFIKFKYKYMEIHIKEHNFFIARVEKYQADIRAGQVPTSADILEFLKDWLIHHIIGCDKKYCALFRKQGLK